MHFALLLPAAALVGVGRRVAGGAFQQWTGINVGDYPARAFYGLTVCVAALLGGAPWAAVFLILAIFLGCAVPNFGGIAMGRSGNSWGRDAIAMQAHGVLSLMLAAAVLAVCVPPDTIVSFLDDPNWRAAGRVIAAGTFCPVAYEIGWCISGKAGNPRFPLGLRGGSEIGEMLWGMVIGAAVAAAS